MLIFLAFLLIFFINVLYLERGQCSFFLLVMICKTVMTTMTAEAFLQKKKNNVSRAEQEGADDAKLRDSTSTSNGELTVEPNTGSFKGSRRDLPTRN